MRPAPPQRELFVRPAPCSDTVVVNDRVCFQTEEKQRVVFVHGVIFSHYAIDDRTAEAYAMVLLFESGHANQNDIERCFGYCDPALDARATATQPEVSDDVATTRGYRRALAPQT
jgi:hypothetical protein